MTLIQIVLEPVPDERKVKKVTEKGKKNFDLLICIYNLLSNR